MIKGKKLMVCRSCGKVSWVPNSYGHWISCTCHCRPKMDWAGPDAETKWWYEEAHKQEDLKNEARQKHEKLLEEYYALVGENTSIGVAVSFALDSKRAAERERDRLRIELESVAKERNAAVKLLRAFSRLPSLPVPPMLWSPWKNWMTRLIKFLKEVGE